MAGVRRFRKKPVVIEAIQWDGENPRAISEFCGAGGCGLAGRELTVFTSEGNLHASIGDWIIKGTKGEFYPCKPDIFSDIYEPE